MRQLVVITILVAAAGFILNKVWDGIVLLLKATH
jgi:hypothetical protein